MNTNGVAGKRSGGMDDVVLVGACVVAVGGVELERLPLTAVQGLDLPFLRELHRMLIVIHPKDADAADLFRTVERGGHRLRFAFLPATSPAWDLIATGPARLEAVAHGVHGVERRGVRGGDGFEHALLRQGQWIIHGHRLFAREPNGHRTGPAIVPGVIRRKH